MEAHDVAIDAVSEAQLVDALDAMTRGDIEYVILESGDDFLQAAGDGAGPYALQFSQGTAGVMEEVRGPVDAFAVRAVLVAYHRGDPRWRGSHEWAAI
jgi:hypothetical protein